MYNQITYFDPATGTVSIQASEINYLTEARAKIDPDNPPMPPNSTTKIHLANGQQKAVADNFHYLKSQINSNKFYEISGPYFINTDNIGQLKKEENTFQDRLVVFKNGETIPIKSQEVTDLINTINQLFPENAAAFSQLAL